jgi:hypothetical protein
MAELMYKLPQPFEPITENRFIINFVGTSENVPEYLFRNFYIYNENDKFILEIEMYNTTNYVFNPQDVFKITDVKIKILSVIGEIINEVNLPVIGSNYVLKGDYKSDDFLISYFRFVIKGENISLLYKNNIENESERTSEPS